RIVALLVVELVLVVAGPKRGPRPHQTHALAPRKKRVGRGFALSRQQRVGGGPTRNHVLARQGSQEGALARPTRAHQRPVLARLDAEAKLLLETAAAQVAELLVLVYANPDDTLHPAPERAHWLRELYRGDDYAAGPRIGNTLIRIEALPAVAVPADTDDDATHREFVRQWLIRQQVRIDVVFSSESYGPGFAEHLGATHVAVDNQRSQVPTSGTRLRAALAEEAESFGESALHIHPFVAAQYGVVPATAVPRLVLLGAESSGKTTL
nr:hypothetical protein [Tanacetum cinerariifolium]